jgi:hypothetical protein
VEPYNDNVEDTLTSNDYSTIKDLALAKATTPEDSSKAYAIEDYESFSDSRPASEYVPMFLADKYMALNKSSVANVTYNYYEGEPTYLSGFGTAEAYTLQEADYDAMGEEYGEPGYYDNFSDDMPPEDYLPDFLAGKYPNATDGTMKAITYDYYKGYVVPMTDYYQFSDGSWNPVPNVYVLSSDDYDSMGEPGGYDNFSGSIDPDNYLPTFLELKFPYANKDDMKVVVYDYYTGDGVEVRAAQYSFDGSAWKKYDPTKMVTNQFIHNGEKWIFDPTVKFTMESSDYQLVVDERDSKYLDDYGTGEFYSGSNSYYSNFDMRLSKRVEFDAETFDGLTLDEALPIMWERLFDKADEPMATRGALIVMLQKKFPNAQPQSNGVDVYYEVTFETFNDDFSRSTYTAKYQCTAAGDPAQFKFVETDAPYEVE